ncbi:putative RNA-directed DNA polymerase, eukaryota, reverse transcriptase zinc-binding domain protein [Tanacetum coccineum]
MRIRLWPSDNDHRLILLQEIEKIDKSSKLIMVKKEVSIQMIVASRAFGLTLLEPRNFVTSKRIDQISSHSATYYYYGINLSPGGTNEVNFGMTGLCTPFDHAYGQWVRAAFGFFPEAAFKVAGLAYLNFHGWSRNVKIALGAKLKLGFIDGSCLKPDVGDAKLQRWIRCDYMVTCWILNSMVTELSDAFLYAHSACELWKEIAERYGQSNGPLVNQLERELCKISQGILTIASYFNKLKKCWDELENINGLPTCDCGKIRECTCDVLEKFLLRDSYPNWYKGKKAKTQGRIVAHVNSGFDKYFSGDSPFDMGNENEIVAVGKGSRCLYICKPTVDPTAFSDSISEFNASHLNSVPVTCLDNSYGVTPPKSDMQRNGNIGVLRQSTTIKI